MSKDGPKNQADVARLIADLRAAKVELLSAQCATDRIRLQYSLQDIISFGEPQTLKGAIASANALCSFYSQIHSRLEHDEAHNE